MLACVLTFPVRSDQINSLHYVSGSSTPCRDLWGIFSLDFLQLFFPPCGGFISCLDLLGFLWMSRRCRWSRHCVANSVVDGQSWKTENQREVARRFVRLRRMFTIFILNNRVPGSWDNTQSRLWTITQPLLRVKSWKTEETLDRLARLFLTSLTVWRYNIHTTYIIHTWLQLFVYIMDLILI